MTAVITPSKNSSIFGEEINVTIYAEDLGLKFFNDGAYSREAKKTIYIDNETQQHFIKFMRQHVLVSQNQGFWMSGK